MRRSMVLCLALLVVLGVSTACGSDPEPQSAAGDELDVGVPFDDDIPFTAFFRDESEPVDGSLFAPDAVDEVAGVTVERDADEPDEGVVRVPLQDQVEALGEIVARNEQAAAVDAADAAGAEVEDAAEVAPSSEMSERGRGHRDAPIGTAPTAGSAASPRGNRTSPGQRSGTP